VPNLHDWKISKQIGPESAAAAICIYFAANLSPLAPPGNSTKGPLFAKRQTDQMVLGAEYAMYENILDALRYERTAPKVIAMSGAWDGLCLPAAAKLGAQAVLPKPWENQRLLDTVRAVLGGSATGPVVETDADYASAALRIS
jgi:hypothetical protein